MYIYKSLAFNLLYTYIREQCSVTCTYVCVIYETLHDVFIVQSDSRSSADLLVCVCVHAPMV